MSNEIEHDWQEDQPNWGVAETTFRDIVRSRSNCDISLDDITVDEKLALIEALRKLSLTRDGGIKLRAAELILKRDTSDEVRLGDISWGLSKRQIEKYIDKDSFLDLIKVMSKNLETHRFSLGFLLTIIKITDLPPEIVEKLKPVMRFNELKLMPENGSWYLCSSAEARLVNAIDDMAVVEVNETLLVKMIGKMSGLCTKTTVTSDGFVFLEGSWYSPVDERTRKLITRAFDNGTGCVNFRKGEWAFMRAATADYDISYEKLLERARETINKCIEEGLPERISGMTREEYRDETEEYF